MTRWRLWCRKKKLILPSPSSGLPWTWSSSTCWKQLKQQLRLRIRRGKQLKQPAASAAAGACGEWGGEAVQLPLPLLHRGRGQARGQPLLQEVHQHQREAQRQCLLLRSLHLASHPGEWRGQLPILRLSEKPLESLLYNRCLPCTGVQTPCIKTIREWQLTKHLYSLCVICVQHICDDPKHAYMYFYGSVLYHLNVHYTCNAHQMCTMCALSKSFLKYNNE